MASCEFPEDMIKRLEYVAYVEWLAPYIHKNAQPPEFAVYLDMRGRCWEKTLKNYPDYLLEIIQYLSIFKHTLKVDESGTPFTHPLTRNRFNNVDSLISRYILALLLESEFNDQRAPNPRQVTKINSRLSEELGLPKSFKQRLNIPPSIIVTKALQRMVARRFVGLFESQPESKFEDQLELIAV